ncbi:UNVERIFIED_CONTAM: Retrovirus-related Pol polyprotein from transposon TNT 1-94 [Sesamum angustifolium]|uniref:Retrovirus-related Pol polyprotein from transposon TNT 1-94 n=1 Tax=Sesamum angustifolium TaxID=2727405 RepID=A0AAW2L0J8_9LAMI
MALSKTTAKTPYEIWYDKLAFDIYLRVFITINGVFLQKDFLIDTRREELLPEESSGATPQAAVASSSVPIVPTENIPILRKSTKISQSSEICGLFMIDMESMSSNKVLKRKVRADGKIFLPIYAYHDYKAWQMDVKITFLNGFIKEDIDLDQLVDFIFIGEKQKVNGSPAVFLVLYINDVLIIGNDVKMLSDTKAWVSMQFCMKDLSDASYILDIKIYRDRSRRMLGLTQASYIEKS